MENVNLLRKDPDLRNLLRRRAAQHLVTAAICAGPLVLADAGLLNGRRITCHASVEEEFKGAVALADYDELVDTCVKLVQHDAQRKHLEDAGFAVISARDECAYLKTALIQTAAYL